MNSSRKEKTKERRVWRKSSAGKPWRVVGSLLNTENRPVIISLTDDFHLTSASPVISSPITGALELFQVLNSNGSNLQVLRGNFFTQVERARLWKCRSVELRFILNYFSLQNFCPTRDFSLKLYELLSLQPGKRLLLCRLSSKKN